MPLIRKIVTQQQSVVTGIHYNKCNKDFYDIFEMQDSFHYSNIGGYSSKIGDGVEYEITLCQDCFVEVLGKYLYYQQEEE